MFIWVSLNWNLIGRSHVEDRIEERQKSATGCWTGRDAASPLRPVPATTSASGHTEDKSQGPPTGHWTGRDPMTTASGPGHHHHVRSCELGFQVNSNRTLSVSGQL
jgi:hypothetical protein